MSQVIHIGRHRIGCGNLLTSTFQAELWAGAPAQAGMVMLDPPYGAAIDREAARRAKKAGMRMGKLTCVTEEWDMYEGDWPRYAADCRAWLAAAVRYRAPGHAMIVWAWSHSLRHVIAAGVHAGLRIVTIFTWAKPNASPRFVRNTAITKSTEFAAIFRGPEKLEFHGPLIRDHVVMSSQRRRIGQHETEKPVDLYHLLIERFCPPGGIVYDPMMGSGTTVAVCEGTGRAAIAADNDPRWFDEAITRVGRPPGLMRPGDQGRLIVHE